METHSTLEKRSQSVATLLPIVSCPICGTPLTGGQTVCSPKCRTKRATQKKVKLQADRDATARLHLRAAQYAYAEGARHLAEALDLLLETP